MRVASIDVGSYSVRLTVAELKDSELKILYEEGRITSLGSGVRERGKLSEDRVEETLRVLREYRRKIEELGAERVVVVGTEALRRAENAEEFIKRVKEETGFELRIISPEEEGRYAFLAVAFSLKPKGKVCVIDQGGGSTEFVFGKNLQVDFMHSFPFGIVNLTERFLKHDPPTEEEVSNLLQFLEREIEKVKRETDTLVGLGGTITTLAALEYGIYPYDPNRVHGKKLSYEAVKRWFETLRRIPAKERAERFRQIEDRRAEVILAGIAIFLKTLGVFGKEEITVSDWGLREGILVAELLRNSSRV